MGHAFCTLLAFPAKPRVLAFLLSPLDLGFQNQSSALTLTLRLSRCYHCDSPGFHLIPDPFAKIIEPLRTNVATWALLSATSALGWIRGTFMGTRRGQSTFMGGFVLQTRHFHRKEQDTGGTEMTILRMPCTSTPSSSPTCGSSRGFRWIACCRGYRKQILQRLLPKPGSNHMMHGETFPMPRKLRNGLLELM